MNRSLPAVFAAVNREYLRGAVTGNGTGNFVETYPEKKAIPICEYYFGAEIDVTDAERALFLGSTKKTDGDRLFAESPLETIVYGSPQNVPRTFYGTARNDVLDFVNPGRMRGEPSPTPDEPFSGPQTDLNTLCIYVK